MRKKIHLSYIKIALIGLAIIGCAKKPEPKNYPLTGPCYLWNLVEVKREGKKKLCWTMWKDDKTLRCNRERGHAGRHHIHYVNDCVAIF